MRFTVKKIPVKVDWESLRHSEELQEILNPVKPSGAEFARKAERAIFEYMLELGITKIYTWDDYVCKGSMARWEWHYGAVRPEGHACVEYDLSNLVEMSDMEFEQLVRSLPKSPNENLVREWRNKMRGLTCKKPFPVPQFNHMPDLYPVDEDELH